MVANIMTQPKVSDQGDRPSLDSQWGRNDRKKSLNSKWTIKW